LKTHEVFGIRPDINAYSYVDRGSLDAEVQKLLDRKHKHIAIRGASKSGKSWLRQKILNNPIVVQCRLDYSVIDIYRDALSRLDVRFEVEKVTSRSFEARISASGEAGLKLLAKLQGGVEVGANAGVQETTQPVGKDHADLEFVASIIKESGRTLVIEDFHYLPTEEQKRFAFDLKTLWDYRLFVVVVGVWSTQNMMITLNPDLSERIEEVSVVWTSTELKKILEQGCRHLGLTPSSSVAEEFASISYESAGLLQSLALRYIDDELGIRDGTASEDPRTLDDVDKVRDAAMHVAEQLNQLYQTFARRVSEGIRSRTNATGIYAHAMAVIMEAEDSALTDGMSAKDIHAAAHARQPRIQLSNLKAVLSKFPSLQVDEAGRGLVLAYDDQEELVSVVDKQLLLYRRFATVRWPWEDLIAEVSGKDQAFD